MKTKITKYSTILIYLLWVSSCGRPEFGDSESPDYSGNFIKLCSESNKTDDLKHTFDLLKVDGKESCLDAYTRLMKLDELDFSNKNIVDIRPFSSLISVENLYLDHNQITSIEPLKNLYKLKKLDLSWNQITDISPIKSLRKLKNFFLFGNPLGNEVKKTQLNCPDQNTSIGLKSFCITENPKTSSTDNDDNSSNTEIIVIYPNDDDSSLSQINTEDDDNFQQRYIVNNDDDSSDLFDDSDDVPLISSNDKLEKDIDKTIKNEIKNNIENSEKYSEILLNNSTNKNDTKPIVSSQITVQKKPSQKIKKSITPKPNWESSQQTKLETEKNSIDFPDSLLNIAKNIREKYLGEPNPDLGTLSEYDAGLITPIQKNIIDDPFQYSDSDDESLLEVSLTPSSVPAKKTIGTFVLPSKFDLKLAGNLREKSKLNNTSTGFFPGSFNPIKTKKLSLDPGSIVRKSNSIKSFIAYCMDKSNSDPNISKTISVLVQKGESCLSAYQRIKKLDRLDLKNKEISNISPLASFKRLKVLILSKNKIQNILPLTHLKKIERLEIDSNLVSDISSLGLLKNLSSLNMNNNEIFSVNSISNLKNLKKIELSNNPIAKPSLKNSLNCPTKSSQNSEIRLFCNK